MEVAADLLKESAFMRRDHNDVSYPLTRLDRNTLRITYVMITGRLPPLLSPNNLPLSRPVFLWRRTSGPCSEQRDPPLLPC
jgi:hypothetical protein